MAKPSTSEALSGAWGHYRAGELRAAEVLCREVLAADPRQAEAWNLLGSVALSGNNPQAAVQCGSTAVRLEGGQARHHVLLGDAFTRLGQLKDAVASYRQSLRLQPSDAVVHHKLGFVLFRAGDLAGASSALAASVRLQPSSAEARQDWGVILQSTGELAAATAQHAEALRLRPGYLDARLGLAQTLFGQGQSEQAAQQLELATREHPHAARAWTDRGTIAHSLAQFDAAVEFHRRAIELEPRLAAAYYNLGTALRELDRAVEAAGVFEQAVRIEPRFVAAWLNLSSTYELLDQPELAVTAARRALELAGDNGSCHGHLAKALQSQGSMDEAITAYRRAVELDPHDAATHSNLLYTLNFHPASRPAEMLTEHRAWAARHAEPLTAVAAPHQNSPEPERQLKIGYVSAHFRHHAVSFFAEPMLAAHDRSRFEIFAYADLHQGDAMTERISRNVDTWRTIAGISDEALAEQIRGDQIDILVDLAGHIGGNRLLTFARKPAPVQVTYLGYQNTTGMSAMDYRLTDEHADPPGLTDQFHTEKLIRLPRSFFCFAPADPAPEVGPPPATTNGYVTFGALNHVQKISGVVLETWARVLAAVPKSRLLVLAYPAGRFEQSVRDAMGRAGVEQERVEIVGRRPRYDYLALHAQVDIALDAFPFNGHTTVCDALWMGVPSIMLEGEAYVSRFGGTTLLRVGLEDLIARDLDQYCEIARRMAGDLPRLAALRAEMRKRMQSSPLLDATGFTRNLEAAYRQMWHSWCGQS